MYDEPMSLHTSLAVGGNADALVFIENEDQLVAGCRKTQRKGNKYFHSGKSDQYHCAGRWIPGSNIVDDRNAKKSSCEYTPQNGYLISAQAGAALAKVVSRSVEEELTGLEFCAGIPGSVGGAVWMNAGAYGKEMKDVINDGIFTGCRRREENNEQGGNIFRLSQDIFSCWHNNTGRSIQTGKR